MNTNRKDEAMKNIDGTCDCGNQCRECGDCAFTTDAVFCGPDQCLVEKAADEAAAYDGPVFTELADAEAYDAAQRAERIRNAESYDDLAGTGAGTVNDPTTPAETPVWQHAGGLVQFRLA